VHACLTHLGAMLRLVQSPFEGGEAVQQW